MQNKCTDTSGSGRADDQEAQKIQRLGQVHILRYIAELTEEMSRLAKDHDCADLADDLSAVAEKAKRSMANSAK